MPVLPVPGTKEAEERVKWEAEKTGYGPPGRPYQYREFPLTLHKAGKALDANGLPKLGAPVIVETLIVDDADHERREHANGFHRHPAEAILMFERLTQLEIPKLAAELNYEVKNRLSAKAGAEVDAAMARHSGHLPSVPETPIRRRVKKLQADASAVPKKRGRPVKQAAVAAEGA